MNSGCPAKSNWMSHISAATRREIVVVEPSEKCPFSELFLNTSFRIFSLRLLKNLANHTDRLENFWSKFRILLNLI